MANKITLKVTKMAFYNGGLVYPNEIIKNYKGEKIPLWATLADGKQTSQKEEAPQKPSDVVENPDEIKGQEGEGETPQNPDDVKGEGEAPVNPDENGEGKDETPTPEDEKEGEAPAQKTEAELMEEYNTLLDEAVAKDILLEDADKKTIVEQIAELKVLLGKE